MSTPLPLHDNSKIRKENKYSINFRTAANAACWINDLEIYYHFVLMDPIYLSSSTDSKVPFVKDVELEGNRRAGKQI